MAEEGKIVETDAASPDIPLQEDLNNLPEQAESALQEANAESADGQPRDNLQLSEE